MELVNFSQEVKDQLYKLATISLCPNLAGQVTTASMLRRAGLQLRTSPPAQKLSPMQTCEAVALLFLDRARLS